VTVVSTSQGKHGGWAGLAVAADGGLIVADYLPNRVRRIDPVSGRGRVLAGQGPPRPRIEL